MRFVPLVLLLSAGPVVAQATQLSPEALARIKGTTCYVKVKAAEGGGTGSGFLVRKSEDGKFGWVATNNHVVAPSTGNRGTGKPLSVQGIEVVFQSGTPQEWRAAGQVAAYDPLRDLATVRFAVPKGVKLAEPLALPGAKASETLPVYICGFPFGANLAEGDKNPEVSIGLGSVSSVRLDDRGDVHRVQINGAINPGNSGGPIVTADGKLVGVAVTTISRDGVSNAGIGHAVPQQHVKEMLDGRVSEPLLLRTGGSVLSFAVVVDPFGRLKVGKGWLAPVGADKKTVPGSLGGIQGAKSYDLRPSARTYRSAVIVESVPLQVGPAVAEVWAQSTWTDKDGAARSGRAFRTPIFTATAGGFMPQGGGPPSDDDDGSGGPPSDFFDGVPGVPTPPPPPAGPPGFAGPGGRPGGPQGRGLQGNGGGEPGPGGRLPNPGGRGRPDGGRTRPAPPDGGPASPPGPSAPLEADTEARSLQLLDRIAANPARADGGKYKLWLTVSGLEVGRLVAQRPDGSPLAGLRVQVDLGLAGTVRADLKKLGGGGHKGLVSFEVNGYDAAEKVAIGHASAVILDPALTGGGPAPGGSEAGKPGEEEEERPNGVAPSRADPPQPVLSAPPTDAPPRPPVAEEGVSSRVIALAVVLMLVAVAGLVGVGLAVMHAGQPGKKKGKTKRSRDWDDEDDEDDDRPRRRRR